MFIREEVVEVYITNHRRFEEVHVLMGVVGVISYEHMPRCTYQYRFDIDSPKERSEQYAAVHTVDLRRFQRDVYKRQYIDIPLERVYEHFKQITDDQVGASCAAVASQALACREGTPEDLIKAMRLYRAIKRICEEEKLEALTLSCFKLIDQIEMCIRDRSGWTAIEYIRR